MTGIPSDWRPWLATLVIGLLIWNLLPPILLPPLLVGIGLYLLYRGWSGISGRSDSGRRVTYWRGRRIDQGPTPAAGPLGQLGSLSTLQVLGGLALIGVGLLLLVR